MPKARGYYRDTRTGAVRQSSSKLGYPYVEASQSEVGKLPGSQPTEPSKPASSTKAGSTQPSKPADNS